MEVAERFERLTGLPLGGGWGMTETSPAGTSLPRDWPDKPGSIGLPLPGIIMEIVALDDPRRVLGAGRDRRDPHQGRQRDQGLLERAARRRAAAFVDGYLLTGDIGFMDEDGYFYLVDRKKDMIISGGFNVYPRTIEEAIYEHPAVDEVIVIGVADAYRGEAAKAFVQAEGRRRAASRSKSCAHSSPTSSAGTRCRRALEFRDTLPSTAVGKLSKKELIEEERAQAREHPASRTRR